MTERRAWGDTQIGPPSSADPNSSSGGGEAGNPEEPATQRRPTAHAMIGALLNHIYHVDRFIAAGGMGAVYEGFNINTDERVAIKIILPHLAVDPRIQALFRNEARTLTRLSNPGLAQYRVLAYEPQLDVFYIVTEFIDGPPLSEVLSAQPVDDALLRSFALRLASGLAAAHELGTIHRDISPDNILLPKGRLENAKIIDFGIAKDLTRSNETVVASGFAGKFAFVAPEQFGDPDNIGPWTDIYSLGLVLLAVARGAPPSMGATILDAIDARKSIPDLSALPADLRRVVAKMLEPDHRDRYQSMHEVVAAFMAPRPAGRGESRNDPGRLAGLAWPAAGGAAMLVLGLVAASFLWSRHPSATAPRHSAPAPTKAAVAEKLRGTLEASLGAIPCTWLDMDRPSAAGDAMVVKLSGVDRTPDAVARIAIAAQAGGIEARIDATNVFAVDRRSCALLDAFRRFREPSSAVGRALVLSQPRFYLQQDSGCVEKGMRQARIVLDIDIGNPADDFSILAMDAKGGIQQLIADRAYFARVRATNQLKTLDLGNDAYRITFCTDQNTALSSPNGLAGLLLIKGQGPFEVGLDPAATDIQTVPADWPAQFAARAQARHWRTQMAWYQVLQD